MKHYLLAHPTASSGTTSVVLTVLRVLVAAFFLFLAMKNLSGDAGMVADFERWGYADWFRRATAVLQIAGALALLLPQTCFVGAGLLAAILLGATLTHVLHDPPAAIASPLVFLVLVSTILAFYRPEALRWS